MNDFLEPKPQIPVKDPFSDELIERMRQDTFYGQSSINLSEVKGRMKKTETIIGSREEIQKFTETCLQRFQSSMIVNESDKTFKITLGDSRLISHVGRDTLDRVIFDPLRGKENPRFEVIDTGHPLIQKLIELGKELVFSNSGFYGRTSALSNDIVQKPLVQYTFLARYTIHTEPISVVEELLTAGISLDGEDKYDWETLTPIVSAPPKPRKESLDQVRNDLKNALSLAAQSPYLEEEAQIRCRYLIEERQRIKESLEAESDHSWLEGYDTVSLASVDLLTLTLYYPAGGAL